MTFNHYLEQKRFTAATVNSYTIYIRTFTDWLATEQLEAGAFTYNELLDFIQYLQARARVRKRYNMC